MPDYSGVHIDSVHDLGNGEALITGTVAGNVVPTYEDGTATVATVVPRLFTITNGRKVYLKDLPDDAARHNVPVMGEDMLAVDTEQPIKVMLPPEQSDLAVLTALTSVQAFEGLSPADQLLHAKRVLTDNHGLPPAPKPLEISG